MENTTLSAATRAEIERLLHIHELHPGYIYREHRHPWNSEEVVDPTKPPAGMEGWSPNVGAYPAVGARPAGEGEELGTVSYWRQKRFDASDDLLVSAAHVHRLHPDYEYIELRVDNISVVVGRDEFEERLDAGWDYNPVKGQTLITHFYRPKEPKV